LVSFAGSGFDMARRGAVAAFLPQKYAQTLAPTSNIKTIDIVAIASNNENSM